MAWRNFGSAHYYRAENLDTYIKNNHPDLRRYFIQFQYDDATVTPTQVKCQAKFDHDSWGNGYGTDFFYLCLLDANDNVSSTHLLHHGGATTKSSSNSQRKIPQVTDEFTLTKAYTDRSFCMPKFVIFCQGRQGTLGTLSQSLYNDGRKNWKDIEDGADYNFVGPCPGSYDGTNNGSINIVNTYKNSFYFTGYLPPTLKGDLSYPNFVTDATIEWEISPRIVEPSSGTITVRATSNTPPSSLTYTTGIISLPHNSPVDSIDVTATLKSVGKYNNPLPTEHQDGVATYSIPKPLERSPAIVSYRDADAKSLATRPSPNSYLKLSWDIGNPGNANSPISGCRIYFYIKKSGDDNWVSYGRWTPSTNVHYENVWYLDRHTNTKIESQTIQLDGRNYDVHIDHDTGKCYTVLSCKDFGIEKGDSCKVTIEPWHYHISRTGEDSFWVLEMSEEDSNLTSGEIFIDSAGVVSTMVEQDKWVEGQVYVYDGEWKEASGVYVNTSEDSSNWKESI